MRTYSSPIKKTCRFYYRGALNDGCGPLRRNEMSCSEEETEEKGFRRVEKAVLTGKVAREQEHHGEDDQERDVRLQDPWGERVEEVYEGSGKGDEMRKEIESLMRNKHGESGKKRRGGRQERERNQSH